MSVLKLCQLSLVIVLSAAVFASAEEPEPKTLHCELRQLLTPVGSSAHGTPATPS
jgi:hypothetical protein